MYPSGTQRRHGGDGQTSDQHGPERAGASDPPGGACTTMRDIAEATGVSQSTVSRVLERHAHRGAHRRGHAQARDGDRATSWATGPTPWPAACAVRPPCCSASSCATSPTPSSPAPSRPPRWRPTSAATTSSSATPTRAPTRPRPCGASWRRATAMPSSSWATCATAPTSSRTCRTPASRWWRCGTARARAASPPSASTTAAASRPWSTTSSELGHERIAFAGPAAPGRHHRARGCLSWPRSTATAWPTPDDVPRGAPSTTTPAARRPSTELMELGEPPTAIVAPTDVIAMGMLHAAQRRGLRRARRRLHHRLRRHPGGRRTACPALTTVRMPTEAMVLAAVDLAIGDRRGPGRLPPCP